MSLFGLDRTYDDSKVAVVAAPWEVTVSYRSGTAQGPASVLHESPQLDLFRKDSPKWWKDGVAWVAPDPCWDQMNTDAQAIASALIAAHDRGEDLDPDKVLAVNAACAQFLDELQETCAQALSNGKKVGLVGGDHSTALANIRAHAGQGNSFGILQIDAHMDLRCAYQGFEYSHASVMNMALALPELERLVQIGIRDYCEEEYDRMQQSDGRVLTFFDEDIKRGMCRGESWHTWCEQIVAVLPQQVYVSVDVDGLLPSLCPGTGTLVPGGMTVEQLSYLLGLVVDSGRGVVGWDVVEVGAGQWDGAVGARVVRELLVSGAIPNG